VGGGRGHLPLHLAPSHVAPFPLALPSMPQCLRDTPPHPLSRAGLKLRTEAAAGNRAATALAAGFPAPSPAVTSIVRSQSSHAAVARCRWAAGRGAPPEEDGDLSQYEGASAGPGAEKEWLDRRRRGRIPHPSTPLSLRLLLLFTQVASRTLRSTGLITLRLGGAPGSARSRSSLSRASEVPLTMRCQAMGSRVCGAAAAGHVAGAVSRAPQAA
jgi:hypothetical protein